jgi:hypothetical protein
MGTPTPAEGRFPRGRVSAARAPQPSGHRREVARREGRIVSHGDRNAPAAGRSDRERARTTKTVTKQVDHEHAKGVGDRTWTVDVDIEASVYIAYAKKYESFMNCYWVRRKGTVTSGRINNNNSSGQSTVEIKKADKFFEATGCTPWVRQ